MTVISGPGELVALVPRLLGYQPRESVVAILLGSRGMVLSALRVDREDLEGEDGADIALQVAAAAAREGACRAVVLTYRESWTGRADAALDRVSGALEDTVGEVGAWRVAQGRYACARCAGDGCCPPGGRQVPGAAAGSVPGRFRAAPVDLRGAAAAERRKSVRAAQRWERRRAELEPSRWRRDSVGAWCLALDGRQGAAALGRVAAGLADVRVRDAALLTLIPGAEAAVADARDGLDSPAVAEAIGNGLRPGVPPDRMRLAEAAAALGGILDHLTGPRACPAAAMLGVLAWWSRDAAEARMWCGVALDLDPGYRLAALVLALVDSEEPAT